MDPLIGRGAELARLNNWVTELLAGHGRAVLVEGEPGIGKSTLLRVALDVAAKRGCEVFWGTADELGQAFPLLPLLDAFAVRESAPDPQRAAVAQALRGGPIGPGAGTVPAAAEQLLALIDNVASATPAVLVIDDLQWADTATAAVWHRLIQSARQRALLLAGAMRPVPQGPDVAALRRAVGPDGLLQLEPLDATAVSELVSALAGGRPGPKLAQLAEDAAGNPLYLTYLVSALLEGNRVAVAGGVAETTDGPVPSTLAEAIIDRLDFLSVDAREVVEAAALLGGDFPIAELAVVLQRKVGEIVPMLAEAVRAGVLGESGEILAFRHPLVRQALYDDVPVSARAAWHRAVAQVLWRNGAPVERVALHLLPAVDHDERVGDWEVAWLDETAPVLVGMAPDVGRKLLRPAVRRLAVGDDRRHRLAAQLAQAASYQGDLEEVERIILETLPHVVDADVLIGLLDTLHTARGLRRTGQSDTMARLERALAAPELSPTARLRLSVMLAKVRYTVGRVDGAEQLAREVLAAGGAQDRWSSAWAANMLCALHVVRGEYAEARQVGRQGLDVTEGEPALTDIRLTLLCCNAEAFKHLDMLDEARLMLNEARRLAERIGNVPRIALVQSELVELFYEMGQWDDALTEAEQYPAGDHYPLTDANVHGVAALIAFHRNDAERGRSHLDAALRSAGQLAGHELGYWVPAGVVERELVGESGAALDLLRGALGRRLSEERLHAEADYLLASIVRLAVALGDKETAGAVTARAEELAANGAVPHRHAAALHCRGWLELDAALLLQAADRQQDAGRPLHRAQAHEAAALVLAESGNVEAARAPFNAALDGYTALGAEWDVERMQVAFRRHGLRVRWTVRKAVTGWDALTAAEARVAELVAQGLSNLEISERLLVSRRTVETHVSNTLAKLEVRSRVDIARMFASRDRGDVVR